MKWMSVILSLFSLALNSTAKEAGAQTENTTTDTMSVRPILNDTASPQLDPFVFSIVKEDTVVAYLRLIVQIMIKEPGLVEIFYHHVPRLRDMIFTDIYGVLCDQWLPTDDPNPQSLKKRIQKVCDQYFGEGKVEAFISHSYLQKYDSSKKDGTAPKPKP